MATINRPDSEVSGKYKVIGTRPIRHDEPCRQGDRAVQYGGDLRLTGMLFGYILRSPHAHAKIKSIDTSRAAALPGVHVVMTGEDMPHVGDRVAELGEGSVVLSDLSRNVMAQGKVFYRGHAVAAVAADNIHIAEEAAKLIQVEYEVLPAVLDVHAAMKPGAPILHQKLRTDELGKKSDKPSNVAKHFRFEAGDLKGGYAKAKVTIEREFNTATVHQGYIEPHNATVLWNADGQITVWTSTQGSFSVRQQVSELLLVPIA